MYGAHLVSWMPADGEECLYLSERSAFEAGRAIRGGIPVIFPQFADRGPLAQHGFARTQAWSFLGASQSGAGTTAAFALESSPRTMALWAHAFRLELRATIAGPRLEVELRVVNPGSAALEFSAALHTYLRVADAARVGLHGLRNVRYLERGTREVEVETRDRVTAAGPVDRIYFTAPAATRLEDAGRVVLLEQRNFTDTVVWNPGRERTAQMADMPPEGFLRMMCVEAASVEPPIALGPRDAWTASQSISIARPS